MNPHIHDPETVSYVNTVLTLYVGLPETPLRASTQDRKLARQLHERGVALCVVESAFLLASVRRLARPTEAPALSPIRSLAYFQPVIEELLSNPAPENYLGYLRLKLRQMTECKPDPNKEAAAG